MIDKPLAEAIIDDANVYCATTSDDVFDEFFVKSFIRISSTTIINGSYPTPEESARFATRIVGAFKRMWYVTQIVVRNLSPDQRRVLPTTIIFGDNFRKYVQWFMRQPSVRF